MLGIWIGKLLLWGLRLLGRQATSLPGKVALRVNPRVLNKLARQLTACVIVTGTNGKTTTANLLGDMLEQTGPLIQNRAGSNMVQGIVSTLLRETTWFGRLRCRRALFEVDEASLPKLTVHLPVSIAVITNVFRDQLDRYGELDTTLMKLIDGLRDTQATLVANADDPLCHYVARSTQHDTIYFGLTPPASTPAPTDAADPDSSTDPDSFTDPVHTVDADPNAFFPRDGAFCLQCGARLAYSEYTYGQLGRYACPGCGFERPPLDYAGICQDQTLTVIHDDLALDVRLPLPGLFNRYNVLAAIAAARSLDVPENAIHQGLRDFQAPVGRMQSFHTVPPVMLNLVKNPTGADNVLQAIVGQPGNKIACIVINDQAADGKDVSWLWDTHFEWLVADPSLQAVVTAGQRAEDMALRLKYAGMPMDLVRCVPELEAAIAQALDLGAQGVAVNVHVIATYTALAPAAACLQRLEASAHRVNAEHRPSVS